MHCVIEDCEYWVGKYRSVEPGAGWLCSFINALFLLQKVTYQYYIYICHSKNALEKGKLAYCPLQRKKPVSEKKAGLLEVCLCKSKSKSKSISMLQPGSPSVCYHTLVVLVC